MSSIQTPACDRCTQGVMDATNPHLLGTCTCECHWPSLQATPTWALEARVDAFCDEAVLPLPQENP